MQPLRLACSAALLVAVPVAQVAASIPFERRASFAGPMAGRPVLADMDRDGDLDVVLACGTCCGSRPDPTSGRVVVLCNDGHGVLQANGPGVPIGPSARKVAVGDLDGDGAPDVVAAEHDTFAVHVLRNRGDGTLSAWPGSPIVAAGEKPHTHDIVLADLDGDAALDVLTTNADEHTVAVWRGDGRGGFAPAAGSPFGTAFRHPYDAMAIADFDGDRRPDVVVPLLRDARIALLRGAGSGVLRSSRTDTVAVSPRPGYVLAVDVDGDGDRDVVASHDDTGVLDVLRNDGTGAFRAGSCTLAQPIWGLATADFDGDGHADLACGAQGGSSVQLVRGHGDGTFTEWQTLAAGPLANHVACGDLDGDGRQDVVASCYGNGELVVFLLRARRP